MMQILSLVIPCYNEEAVLPFFIDEIQRIKPLLKDVELELIFVNDGSTDGTMLALRKMAREYDEVRYLSFSRNFGKESAILAGLEASKGDFVTVIDADLQDPPSLLPQMLKAIREEGYDCAGTRRCTREGEPAIRSFFAGVFYRTINKLSSTQLVDGARDFKLMKRPVVDALLRLQEYNRFSKGLNEWIGFRTKWISYENVERVAGETKWSFWRLFCYSIEGLVAFSTTPLLIASFVGMLFILISILFIIVLGVRQYLYANSVEGWTSMMCLILFLSGVQLFFMGVKGQYTAKMYLELKKRPHYIISERSDEL